MLHFMIQLKQLMSSRMSFIEFGWLHNINKLDPEIKQFNKRKSV